MPAKNSAPSILDASEMTFSEWFAAAISPQNGKKYHMVDCTFATEKIRADALEGIHNLTERQVVQLLRLFLFPGGDFGSTRYLIPHMATWPDLREMFEKCDFVRRVIHGKIETWPNNTWILDLLPDWPQTALNALNAYFNAHVQWLPDGRWSGLSDAQAIIRARYLNKPNPRDVLLDMPSKDFEFLTAALYRRMRYDVMVTSASADGGFDVHAKRSQRGKAESVLIECKRYEGSVDVKVPRALLGVVTSKGATKGVVVTTGHFTRGALSWEMSNPRIDLVGFQDLNILLNKHCGANWPLQVDGIVQDMKQTLAKKEHGFEKAWEE